MRKPAGTPSPIDGVVRTAEQEKELNEDMAQVFRGAQGKAVLDYLKSLTLNNVAGPGIEPNSLMHLEGQRFLVAVIDRRIQAGTEKKK